MSCSAATVQEQVLALIVPVVRPVQGVRYLQTSANA
jgi:hypothetical protein